MPCLLPSLQLTRCPWLPLRWALWTSPALLPAAAERKKRTAAVLQIPPARRSSRASTTVYTAARAMAASLLSRIISCPATSSLQAVHYCRLLPLPQRYPHAQLSTANIAPRSTPAWELWRCTSAHTLFPACAQLAAKPSPGPGCSEDTSARTQVKILSHPHWFTLFWLCWCNWLHLVLIDIYWPMSKCNCSAGHNLISAHQLVCMRNNSINSAGVFFSAADHLKTLTVM